MDYILTSIIFIILGIALLCSVQKETTPSYFSKDFCTICKAIACLVVVYVHFPETYGNKIQDAIGSFAFVGVTCFFMISAYGMQYSIKKKETYLKNFWRNRLIALLVPTFLINCTSLLVYHILLQKDIQWQILIGICGYVKVLLAYCLFFFIVQGIKAKFKLKLREDLVLILGVLVSSLWDYFNNLGVANSAIANWPYERMGLVWGILLYQYRDKIQQFFTNRKTIKTIVMFLLSIILGIVYLNFKHQVFWGEYLTKICLGFAILLFALIVSYGLSFKSKIWQFVGEISFEVYLAHEIVMQTLKVLLGNTNSGTFILATITCTLAIATLLHVIAKPIIKLGRSSN